MFCKECGKKIDDDSKFCNYCGTKQSIQDSDIPANESSQAKQDINVNVKFATPKMPKINLKRNTDIQNLPNKDIFFKHNYLPFIAGVLLIVIEIAIWIRVYNNPAERVGYIIFSTIIKILLAFWVEFEAVKRNRKKVIWLLFGFLFPPLALIIITFINKRVFPANYSRLSQHKKSELNNKYAIRLYKNDYSSEALLFADESILLYPKNYDAYDTRGLIYTDMGLFEDALNDFNYCIHIYSEKGKYNYSRGNLLCKLGKYDKACKDWHTALYKGLRNQEDVDIAKEMIDKYCNSN